jgi:N-acetylglucosaminyl-diphospho-decaprenol L-rhamnosyltransferase
MMQKTDLKLTISLVSHGHRDFVLALVDQLASSPLRQNIKLIITVNSPALDAFDETKMMQNSFGGLIFLKNTTPKGFSTNHNQAFDHCCTEIFCVLNPDIELKNDPFENLLNAFSISNVGVTYPSQVDEQNVSLDFERDLVSPASVTQRNLLRRRHQSANRPVDWVTGAFMVFKSSAFRELGGFDERYFMYCEDVDICLRMQLAGYKLARANATVVHHTRRKTLKNPKHLAWHIRSLFRLWNSAAYKEYKKKFIDSR